MAFRVDQGFGAGNRGVQPVLSTRNFAGEPRGGGGTWRGGGVADLWVKVERCPHAHSCSVLPAAYPAPATAGRLCMQSFPGPEV